jgi:hypothetical protein
MLTVNGSEQESLKSQAAAGDHDSREVDEKNHQMAHRSKVAGRGILRNHARINNSPTTSAKGRAGIAVLVRVRAPYTTVALCSHGSPR